MSAAFSNTEFLAEPSWASAQGAAHSNTPAPTLITAQSMPAQVVTALLASSSKRARTRGRTDLTYISRDLNRENFNSQFEIFQEVQEFKTGTNQVERSDDGLQESAIEKAARERVVILARKYAEGSLRTEDRARLEIATARLRALAPRVTAESSEKLADLLSQADKMSSDNSQIRAQFGLDES